MTLYSYLFKPHTTKEEVKKSKKKEKVKKENVDNIIKLGSETQNFTNKNDWLVGAAEFQIQRAKIVT